ncbi:MAG: PHB depolymerase family esterase [Crocinitomicaceae bacterium]
MKKLGFLLLLALFSTNVFSQQTYETISINGVEREYYMYLPTGYDPGTEELPLLLMLHGIGGTALATSGYGMNQLADSERFIPVYLQGANNGWGQSAWNNGTLLASDAEDLAFISNVIDTINTDVNVNINMARVYMTGISMGSIMTYTACRYMSDRIAAVVCHIGTMSTEDMNNFTPAYPVPTLHKHGTDDQTVPYDSNPVPSLSLVPETIDQLKITNGWNGDSTVTTIPDLAADGITVDKIVYDCTTPLELWRMNDADHILLFEPNNDTNSTEVTWEFLKQYTHPNPSTSSIEKNKSVEAKLFPNPAKESLQFINHGEFQRIDIYSFDGKLIKEGLVPNALINIDFLEAGTYLFKLTNSKEQIAIQKIIVE